MDREESRYRAGVLRSSAQSGVAGPGEHSIQSGPDHLLDEAPHSLAQAALDRIKPNPRTDLTSRGLSDDPEQTRAAEGIELRLERVVRGLSLVVGQRRPRSGVARSRTGSSRSGATTPLCGLLCGAQRK